jgi:cyclic di-GMP phosphodiesterase
MTKHEPAHPATIMVVEDEPAVRRATARILEKHGYSVAEAGSVEEARKLWDEHRPDLALVDIGLPGAPGTALLDETWVQSRQTAVIMVSGSHELDVADDAFAKGAYGYVVKPFVANVLLMNVAAALRRQELERSVARHVEELEHKVVDASVKLRELHSQLESPTASVAEETKIVSHLAAALHMRDDEVGRHVERVSRTAAALADWCGFAVDPTPGIRMAAAMHDIGKIGIPDWVLLKPGRLTDEEMAIVQRHSELGYDLLKGTDGAIMNLAASVALNHHERWDGTGYPHRRRGEDIPMEARITSVADVFDALISDRVYRSGMPLDTAIDIMVRDRAGAFDPSLLDLFLERLDDVMEIRSAFPDPESEPSIRVVIVDDERVFLDGVLRVVARRGKILVVATATNSAEAFDAVMQSRPDVLITDFRLSDGDGAELTRKVVSASPETRVVVLTGSAEPDTALRCVEAGCTGFLSKLAPAEELIDTITRVHAGQTVLPAIMLSNVVSGLRQQHSVGGDVTPREREVLQLLAEGCGLNEICSRLHISVNTGRNHTQRVLEKLGAHSKLEAVIIASREQLISVS